MSAEDEVGVGLVLQIAFEILGEGFQNVGLTTEQATFGMRGGGASGLEIDAMEREFSLQLLDFRSRWRRWRRSLDVHKCCGRSSEGRNAIIVCVAGDGDAAWLGTLCVQRGCSAVGSDISGACRVAVN